MTRSINQEITAIEKTVAVLTDPKGKGHAKPWGLTQESTTADQGAEGEITT